MATKPFSRFEWMIAWRYLRARRAEGGVSVMTWISLIGITLAVFALIATLSVRAGFRAEFVDTILGANSHVTVYTQDTVNADGVRERGIRDYDTEAANLAAVEGVTRAAPLIRGQVMVTSGDVSGLGDVYGIRLEDLRAIPRIGDGAEARGSLDNFQNGVAVGEQMARDMGLKVGDVIRLTSANGVRTAFGTSPRVNGYTIEYIFSAGRYDIDKTRLYMPFAEAQSFFNREGFADEIEVMVENPEQVESYMPALMNASSPTTFFWTWRDGAGSFLRALDVEDNVMFVILSILVLIATMNIVSGLIMLVKNKGRDIGILRTMGLTEGSILRIFFICGAGTGIVGTLAGLILGCLFAIYIDPIFSLVNYVSGGNVWDPEIRGIYHLPAKLQLHDVLTAISLSLGLSFIITIFPARRAARMNPVEALRYE
ncbi:lipoprotein-releasing ABC transporter permease subunit [Falsirhodobacter sp. alg1]|uniref:lipoprotein-releasing ABC transporter permease subunit n=1 Tax=Falsirhodobacter sp. alg1 TaxID=1472418 RepID=UPI0005ED84F8|nr:lipoprotein-releasing ABC transporter permease subunit [Falsirhodobacter sp. alg1]